MSKTLVTMYTGEHGPFAELTLPPIERYARRYGYRIEIIDPPSADRDPCWAKLPAMARALDDADVAAWVDGDVFFVNDDADLADALTPGKFLAILHDVRYGICAAVYALRRCELAQQFLRDAWAMRDREFPDPDQGAMRELLFTRPEYEAGVAFLDYGWAGPICSGPGARIIHGCRETADTVPERVQTLRRLIADRVE